MISFRYLFYVAALVSSSVAAAVNDELCPYLENFLNSVEVEQTASIELHTSWGKNFKGETRDVMAAKRCVHADMATANDACDYLMRHTSTEFADLNFKRFLKCLAPKTQIDSDIQFSHAVVSLYFGSEERGAYLELSLGYDEQIDGMVLKLEAEGY